MDIFSLELHIYSFISLEINYCCVIYFGLVLLFNCE